MWQRIGGHPGGGLTAIGEKVACRDWLALVFSLFGAVLLHPNPGLADVFVLREDRIQASIGLLLFIIPAVEWAGRFSLRSQWAALLAAFVLVTALTAG